MPNWNNEDEIKYVIYYNHQDNKIDWGSAEFTQIINSALYLKSRELAERLIETHKKELLIYFGVKGLEK